MQEGVKFTEDLRRTMTWILLLLWFEITPTCKQTQVIGINRLRHTHTHTHTCTHTHTHTYIYMYIYIYIKYINIIRGELFLLSDTLPFFVTPPPCCFTKPFFLLENSEPPLFLKKFWKLDSPPLIKAGGRDGGSDLSNFPIVSTLL